MSDYARRTAMPSRLLLLSPELSLRASLERVRVTPLDDAWVAKAMRLAQLGFPPWVSDLRANVLRSLGRKEEEWKIFSYDEYVRQANADARLGRNPRYGAPVPPEIAERVRKIDRHVPGIKFIEVHALEREDPYVRVIRGNESAWIGGWYGRGKRQRLFLAER